MPFTFDDGEHNASVFLYLSLEHPLRNIIEKGQDSFVRHYEDAAQIIRAEGRDHRGLALSTS